MSDDVWLAHGIHFNDDEGKRLGKVGMGGSASNDSSNLLTEVKQALLIERVINRPKAITVQGTIRLATLGGTRCLGRNDVGY